MGVNNSEGAMPPMNQVESAAVEAKKSLFSFPKFSRPRFLGGKPKTEIATDITPAAQATDFVPPAQAIDTGTSPLSAVTSETHVDPTPVDAVAKNVEADLTAQMAAHVNSIPGTARPPEVVGFGTPTNPPTETVTASPMAAEAGAVAPTPIRTENPLEPPTALTEEPAA